jgi:hypothetical protein
VACDQRPAARPDPGGLAGAGTTIGKSAK